MVSKTQMNPNVPTCRATNSMMDRRQPENTNVETKTSPTIETDQTYDMPEFNYHGTLEMGYTSDDNGMLTDTSLKDRGYEHAAT